MNKNLIHLIIFYLVFVSSSFAQSDSAMIQVNSFFRSDSQLSLKKIQFNFNGIIFNATDSSVQKIPINNNFDSCVVIIDNDTINFLTKFQANNWYIIRSGCCCSAFTLEAENNRKRGTATFKNQENRILALSVCEHTSDSVLTNQTKTLFASESAMCMYKPCKISVCESPFLTAHFDSELYEKSFLASRNYHFLHGEKIEVLYSKETNSITFKIIGYLTDDEYDKL